MKNILRSSKNLYNLTLFNHKKYSPLNKTDFSLILKCSLIQKNMHKKNILNFVFLLCLLSQLKPKLLLATKSNALLNIRKGSLLNCYLEVKNLSNIFKFISYAKIFRNNNLKTIHFNNVLKNTYKLVCQINLLKFHYGSLLVNNNIFDVEIITKFSSFCPLKQKFIITSL